MTRNYFKQGKIDEYRVRQLEAVNGWSWNPTKDKWEGAFNDFLEYVEGGGNVRSPDNTRWRNWVKQQRKRYFCSSKTNHKKYPRAFLNTSSQNKHVKLFALFKEKLSQLT